MSQRDVLKVWLEESLANLGGTATIPEVCWQIWRQRENDLKDRGDLFVTWQYEVRWAARMLRQDGVLRTAEESPKGVWELA